MSATLKHHLHGIKRPAQVSNGAERRHRQWNRLPRERVGRLLETMLSAPAETRGKQAMADLQGRSQSDAPLAIHKRMSGRGVEERTNLCALAGERFVLENEPGCRNCLQDAPPTREDGWRDLGQTVERPKGHEAHACCGRGRDRRCSRKRCVAEETPRKAHKLLRKGLPGLWWVADGIGDSVIYLESPAADRVSKTC